MGEMLTEGMDLEVDPEEIPEPKDCEVVGFLSNFEVLQFMKEKKEEGSSKTHRNKLKRDTHLNTVMYETLQYLQGTPCSVQTEEALGSFMSLVQSFELTKAEKLSILNTRPTQPVDIQAIVEESEERLTEDQVNDLLDVVQKALPPLPTAEEEPGDQT